MLAAHALRLHGLCLQRCGRRGGRRFLDAADLLIDDHLEAAVAVAGDAVSAQFPYGDAVRMLAARCVARLSSIGIPTRARGDMPAGTRLFWRQASDGRELLVTRARVSRSESASRSSRGREVSRVYASSVATRRRGRSSGRLSTVPGSRELSARSRISSASRRSRRPRRALAGRSHLARREPPALPRGAQPVIEAPVRGGFVVSQAARRCGDFEAQAELVDVLARRYGFALYSLLVSYGRGLLCWARIAWTRRGAARERAGAGRRDRHPPPGLHAGLRPDRGVCPLGPHRVGSRLSSAPRRSRASRCHVSAASLLAGGLLADDSEIDEPFVEAIALHEAMGSPFELARSRLCFGERQRRSGRCVEAREQLRLALATFDELGAMGWGERARAELRATRETLRREAVVGDELTPQELQIAIEVACGRTNREVCRLSSSVRRLSSSTSFVSTVSSLSDRVFISRDFFFADVAVR